jgi:hypothetical protein
MRFVKEASQLEVTSDIGHKIITLWSGTELLAYRTQTMSSVISRHERFNHSYSEQPYYQLTNSLTKPKLLHRRSIFNQFQTRLNLVICLCKITHVGKLLFRLSLPRISFRLYFTALVTGSTKIPKFLTVLDPCSVLLIYTVLGPNMSQPSLFSKFLTTVENNEQYYLFWII